ncbi:Vacuolar-sorting receptor [Perkinsus olseni]|uniref:Vacuolar-sorting receptor n=1 Tax=Perkinsus olseni TaxID=32597 RepID=A0A7J6RTW4_PEROL|nr:Vacuolar-sorting receptor [Perkinsus olseni]
MSASRKLQASIDVTLKKVDEGIDEFQQVWRKVEESQNQNQREKNQMDLKKEIKKLQRYREDIMKWISGTEVKDKGKLTDTRRKIEVEMERFKEFERESKTKPFSFMGLQAQDKVDPAEQKRMETRGRLESYVDQLTQQNDEYTAEMEKIMGEGGREKGKKKKSKGSKLTPAESTRVAELKIWIARHQWHQAKLEQLIRKLDNEEDVDYDELEITEQALDYYLEEHENPDYYHDEELYVNHHLDDNRVNAYTKPIDVDESKNADGEPTDTQESQESSDEDKPKKPVKEVPLSAGAKAMQKALAAKAAGYQPPSKSPPRPTLPALPSISPPAPPSPPAVPNYPPPPLGDDLAPVEQKEDESAKVNEKVPTPTNATASTSAASPPQTAAQAAAAAAPPPGLKAPVAQPQPAEVKVQHEDTRHSTPVDPAMELLLRSYENRPTPDDRCCTEGTYMPANPIPSSAARKSPYPQRPVDEADSEAVFQKLPFDTLMFVFYYRPGTYAQYLAARELKRMSWRFHSRYGTWFKRHSEPSVVNPKYEYGTYVYFDCYADEWAQKIKKDFQFERTELSPHRVHHQFYLSMRLSALLVLGIPSVGQVRVIKPEELVMKIDEPWIAKNIQNNGFLLGATATFGTPHYGQRQRGRLVFADSKSHHCQNDYDVDGQEFNSKDEKVGEAASVDGSNTPLNIVVVERGTCTFVSKVRVAEAKKNAAAVLILQSYAKKDQDISMVVPADDGYGSRVNVPTILLNWEDSELLRTWLNRFNSDNSKVTDVRLHKYVLVELSWNLPAQHVVVFDWWTSAGRQDSYRLFQEMAPFFREMKGRINLRPHYNVFSLDYKAYEDMCLSVDEHTYCSDDVDSNSQLTGRMVVNEGLRQLCIREMTAESLSAGDAFGTFKHSDAYIEYKAAFLNECPASMTHDEWKNTAEDKRFGGPCAERVMKKLGIDVTTVEKCMKDDITKRSILNAQVQTKAWSPSAIRINGWRYAGDLEADPIRRAICSAFTDPPSACSKYLSPDIIYQGGVTFGTVVLILLGILAGLGIGMLIYKKFITRSLQAQLREEVMLEVKSQMAEYTPLTNH